MITCIERPPFYNSHLTFFQIRFLHTNTSVFSNHLPIKAKKSSDCYKQVQLYIIFTVTHSLDHKLNLSPHCAFHFFITIYNSMCEWQKLVQFKIVIYICHSVNICFNFSINYIQCSFNQYHVLALVSVSPGNLYNLPN